MCGIAGFIAGDEMATVEKVRRMTDSIVHRGPDEEGVFTERNVGLGMRRLSIIDLSGGSQPIYNEDRSVVIVYNGEVYNFPDLRKDLESKGHSFYTHTDTEVVVHLYEEMGAGCISKLRGMFALALYDWNKQTLLLARDRLGKKPLHYAVVGNTLYFASEIKSILAVAPELAEVDLEGVLQYFYYGYIPDPRTAFKRIKKLPPGHLLEYQRGAIKVRQYWDVPTYGTNRPKSEAAGLEELDHRLAEATRIRLISDVPLGALLSGGVDSSIVVALMARASSAPIKTFSIGFKAEQFNELPYARLVAERFGTDHHELIIDPDFQDTLEFLSRMMEEPFGDSSMLATYYVCRMARQHVTVALSGDGGDELFAGYDRYLGAIARRRYDRIPQWVGRFYRDHLHERLPAGTYGRNLAWNASLAARDRYLDEISFFPALQRERGLFSDEFLGQAEKLEDPWQLFRAYYDKAPASDPIGRLLYLDTKTYLAGDILTKVDRMSMATSLEVRVPMLDHEFVEWVAALPMEWKLRGGARKYLLKRLAEKLGIPGELLHRRKQGFQLPLVDWMRKELKQELLQILLEPRTLQRGYFKPKAVRMLVDEHVSERRNRSGLLWRLLILELWHRNFLEARQFNSHPELLFALEQNRITASSTAHTN
jgi:asparagine synthase (glutamine-hydrolysing)